MIHVFYGENRAAARQAINQLFAEGYESLDGDNLSAEDLPSIFLGSSLFATHRQILIQDFISNKSLFDELPKFLSTPHDVILLETKLDKRTATYKTLKSQIDFREFKAPEQVDSRAIFEIYRLAKQDGAKAVQLLKSIEPSEDPIKFTGLLVSQAIKDFVATPGAVPKRRLKELAATDLAMKTTKIDPWLLVESFLLRMQSL